MCGIESTLMVAASAGLLTYAHVSTTGRTNGGDERAH